MKRSGRLLRDRQYTDAETGLIYMRARYYDPATAQFLSRDPITALTQAPYSYVDNDPLNGTDPMGLCTLGLFGKHCHIAKTLAIGAAVVGAAAVVVATAGTAAPVLAAVGVSAETAGTISAGLGVASTLASVGVAGLDCSKRRDAQCLVDIAEAAGGGLTNGIGKLAGAANPALNLAAQGLGLIFDAAGLSSWDPDGDGRLPLERARVCRPPIPRGIQ